ncbi:hypothetical protein SDC9_143511 [bioreactor metagenome]|uniref:Uncharacterized protein n=1 Tax=bioreactor metagenome TaxID=1076179 RepID=A0A645E458_9ZZZZ
MGEEPKGKNARHALLFHKPYLFRALWNRLDSVAVELPLPVDHGAFNRQYRGGELLGFETVGVLCEHVRRHRIADC